MTWRKRILFVSCALIFAMLACTISGGQNGESPVPSSQKNTEALALDVPGITAITIATPNEGAGGKPLFEWEAVPGAVRYSLVLFSADGQPYWSWEGSETKVYLGGTQEQPEEDSPGPTLYEEMSWHVAAFDAEGQLIAVSPETSISP